MQYTYVRYSFGYSERELLVAYMGMTPHAIQFTDRHHDPRNGYAIRKNQPVKDDAVMSITPEYFWVLLDGAIRIDTNPMQAMWQRDRLAAEIEHATQAHFEWAAKWNPKWKPAVTPTWAFILNGEPKQHGVKPAPKVAKPKKVKVVTSMLEVEGEVDVPVTPEVAVEVA